MELFEERGYNGTTVEEIAARAGLTERTFFRYFSDKREVLFSGSRQLEEAVTAAIAGAPAGAAPIDVVVDAFEAAAERLEALRDYAWVRARWGLLVEHAELRERELIKLAALAAAVAGALRERGVPEPTASLVAEAGLAIFKVGFERWVAGAEPRSFAAQVRAAHGALAAIVGAGPSAA